MAPKKIRMCVAALVVMAISGVFVLPASAGAPSGCTDLGAFPPQPAVDFGSQIQPILSVCTGCHGEGGSAGLDLRPGVAWGNLVGVESTTSPPQLRVRPFEPEQSLLLAAINCAETGGPSFQMPGTAPNQRALVRDWIAQGALPRVPPRSIPSMSAVGSSLLAILVLGAALLVLRSRSRHRPI